MKKVFLYLFVLSSSLFAQIGNPADDAKSFMLPNFYLEALSNKSLQPGKSRLDVYIQVPFSNVQFIRNENTFTASYTVTVTLFDENKENILYDQNWVERLKTDSFEEANSSGNSNYSQRSIDIKPGKYSLYCSVEDLDSKRLSFSEAVVTVRPFSDSLEISDALIIDQIIKDKDAEQLIPNVARIITTRTTELPLYFELYSDKNQTCTIEYTMKDKKENVLYTKTEDKNLIPGVNKIFYTIKDAKFVLGEIYIGILVKKDGKDIKSYIKVISGRIYGLPVSISSIDDAIDQMAYVASGSAISFIKESKDNEEKIKKFFDFWDEKKPFPLADENPFMKEYYKRVDFSNKHFKGMPAGWKSDMGMVYIILGPPDIVERQPMPAESNPYEVWTYSRFNRQYIFYDQNGFGSYRLQNPDYDLLNGAGIR